MKNVLIVLLVLATSLHGFGQKLKKVKQKVKEGYSEYTETYYVLKSDKTTKHGQYIKESKYRGVEEKGYYKNGVKDSLWIYYRNGKKGIIESQGYFSNGEKLGAWNFYNYQGELSQTYDLTKDTILFDIDTSHNFTYKLLNSIDTTVESHPPTIIGGMSILNEKIARALFYPPLAVENNIQGVVFVSFEIDEKGKGKNVKLVKGLDPDLDAEALRAVKVVLNEIEWYTWGQNIKYLITMPIKFRIL